MTENTQAPEEAVIANPDVTVDELTLLKQRADTMQLRYSPNIGVDGLKKKIAAAIEGTTLPETPGDVTGQPPAVEEGTLTPAAAKAARRAKMRKEQMRLLRVRITCMNPDKADLHGEFFTTGNGVLGTVKRYVPYGEASENGWHLPYIIVNQLKSRKFLQKRPRTVKGQIQVDTKWVPEFAIEILEPLTPEELKDLANQQAAAGAID